MATRRHVDEDTRSFGVGPVTLDVVMARDLGWSEERIEHVAAAVGMLSRGAGMSQDIEKGVFCEGCFGRPPDTERLPCYLCGRKPPGEEERQT